MDLFEKWILGTDHRGWACSRAIGITLEVGIGSGRNLPEYPAHLTLIGVDLSPEMLNLASARARQLRRAVELLETDAEDLPFPDSSFDTVVCTYALCTIGDDKAAVNEMQRVVRPGGRLFLVDHVRSTLAPIIWMQWLYELVPRRTGEEYMTRRPAEHIMAHQFQVVARDRLRFGVVERLVAVKRRKTILPDPAAVGR
jgi:ubiquinone/menaquinone biosynthesis C-methylase UbiE